MATTGKKRGLGKGLEALIPHWQDMEQEARQMQTGTRSG
jgi:ParB family transcriptional regulator, chromosome partitioning protein